MKKLLTTTEFVFWAYSKEGWDYFYDRYKKVGTATAMRGRAISGYARLMKRPLELGFFIPCVDGKPIEKPEDYLEMVKRLQEDNPPDKDEQVMARYHLSKQYQQAKERVLFEGWKPAKVFYSDGAKKGKMRLQFHNSGVANLHKGAWSEVIRTIEDLVRQIDLTPTKTLLKEIGL